METHDRPTKRQAFLTFYKEGWVSLHLDARRSGVLVPKEYATEPHLVLQYGERMPVPITDLEVSDRGVSAILSFSQTAHRTRVPWSAVYVIATTDGRGVVYHEDVPDEVSLAAAPIDAMSGKPLASAAGSRGRGTAQAARAARHARQTDEQAADETESRDAVPGKAARSLRSVPAESPPTVENDAAVATPTRSGAAVARRRRPHLRLVK